MEHRKITSIIATSPSGDVEGVVHLRPVGRSSSSMAIDIGERARRIACCCSTSLAS